MTQRQNHPDSDNLAGQIKAWGKALGFQQVGITNVDLHEAERHLEQWLDAGYHGEMAFMAKHGSKRTRPDELEPGTRSVISVRIDYLPPDTAEPWQVLKQGELAYISRYALGRDYHKLVRKRLQQLADQIEQAIGPYGYRVFVDSAPVMEVALAEKAGLGWVGKHSNLLSRESGSWFFLGEIYLDLPLPADRPGTPHCGTCGACIDICPTAAIVEPYVVDARRCISYLTIELHGPIPLAYRPLMGNRIYGCDDCQLVCPWNSFAQYTREEDFLPRHGLDCARLLELFTWDEATFLHNMEGSAIRRIGHERWLRNIAVALGNAPYQPEIVAALQARAAESTELVREHCRWALEQQEQKRP